jgi:hypothetical protein
VYEPKGAPEASAMARRQEVPSMTPGRAALVILMQRYVGGLMDPFVSLLEVHKLLYFLQEAGEGLRLRYRKALYGPYAENLTHLLRTVDGDTRERFDMVADLVDGFETPFGLELLATVHWVTRYEGAGTVDEVITATYGWNDRKRRFSREQLALAHGVLQRKGWLEARPT